MFLWGSELVCISVPASGFWLCSTGAQLIVLWASSVGVSWNWHHTLIPGEEIFSAHIHHPDCYPHTWNICHRRLKVLLRTSPHTHTHTAGAGPQVAWSSQKYMNIMALCFFWGVGGCLVHQHTRLGCFDPNRWVLLTYYTVFKTPPSMNNQEHVKEAMAIFYAKHSCHSFTLFPWAMRVELLALFQCQLIGTLIFYEYQAWLLVSVG